MMDCETSNQVVIARCTHQEGDTEEKSDPSIVPNDQICC